EVNVNFFRVSPPLRVSTAPHIAPSLTSLDKEFGTFIFILNNTRMYKHLSIVCAIVVAYTASAQSTGKADSKFIDVSHEIENGMTTYRGVPPPVITPLMTREASKANYSEGVTFL